MLQKRDRSSIFLNWTLFISLLFWQLAATATSPVKVHRPLALKLDSSNIAQRGQDVQQLELEKPIEGQLVSGEVDNYQIAIASGQYLQVAVQQRGIDLIVKLFGPNGKELLEVDSYNNEQGPELISFIAELSGTYRLEVRPLEKTATGRYEVKLEDQRSATEEDRTRISRRQNARKILEEAETLRARGTPESRQSAIAKYQESLSIWQEIEDLYWQAMTLNNIGKLYSLLGDNRASLDYYDRALPLFREVGDRYREADTLNNIGLVYSDLSDQQKALESYTQAMVIFQEVGDRAGEAATLANIGKVYSNLGEKQKALDYYERSLPLLQAVGDKSGEAATLNNIGKVYSDLGEKQKALDYYERSLSLYRAAQNRFGAAFTLVNIGAAYDALGDKKKALDYYDRALPLIREMGNKYAEAIILSNIGLVYEKLGEFQQALDYYNQALPINRAVGNRSGEGVTLANIGAVYASLGDQNRALEYYNQALELKQAVGDKAAIATLLNNIGFVYYELGDKQKALDYYDRALPINRTLGNRSGEADNLNNIALVYYSSVKLQQALEYYERSLALYRAIGEKQGVAIALTNIGLIYAALDRPEEALDYYNQSLEGSQAVGDRSQEASTLFSIARLESDRGNFQEALKPIEDSLKIIENLRTKVASQELRTAFFASKQDYYEFYIDLLMQLHKQRPKEGYDAKALQASERAKARSLLEILAEAGADIRSGVDPKLLERDRTLQQQLNELEKRRLELLSGEYTPEQAIALNKENENLLSQYQEVQGQIRATSPRYAALTQPQPLSLSEIQQQVLDDDTLLLEYSLGSQRSYLWAVTKTTITSYELPPRQEIEAAARPLRESFINPRDRRKPAKFAEASQALSELILAPVASILGQKRLLIVSDGVLQYTPFSALSVPLALAAGRDSQPLIVDREIVTLPSASTAAILRRELKGRPTASKALAVLADPVFTADDERLQETPESGIPAPATSELDRSARDAGVSFARLPFTRQEAQQILALVPEEKREQAFDFSASRSVAISPELSEYRILHFATHGLLNSTHPELSGLVLSLVDERGKPQNGFLRLQEIYNLNLPAELVVLSACQTGLGKEIKGEGLLGLTRGFMYAGAARVVVSLWSVDDEATGELMVRFYRKMLLEGLKPTAALRAAQIEMWQQEKWRSPYYWAAFTLQGEWQ